MKRRSRTSHSDSRPSYELLEPRNLLAGDILVGNLNSGVAISDDANGTGHVMYSEVDVHSRFSGILGSNADHFIATRLDGTQWQYNNNLSWIDFTPVSSDLLVAEVNFGVDSVARLEVGIAPYYYSYSAVPKGTIVQGVEAGFVGEDLRFAPNRFNGVVNAGEIQVLGSSFSRIESSAELTESESKLEQLGFALHRYESITEKFPRSASIAPDGTALLSWRVHLLPMMGLENLYEQFNLDEPWDSANNLPLASQMPDVYSSPHFSSSNETSFLAMTGSGTVFPEFGFPVNFGSIRDGSHTTLMFVEANADQKIIWTQPGDLEFDPADPLAGLGSISPDGFAAVMADGEASTIPAAIDAQNFSNMALRDDGNFVDFSDFAPYTSSGNSLKQVVLSLHNYESAYQRFPAHAIYSADGTTPLLSWRVSVLPYLEHNDLYDQFHLDEPWDSPHNLSLLPLMPRIYAHPDVANGMTNYLGVSGPEAIFDLSNTGLGYAQFRDGSSNTVMLVEADADQAVEWTKPQDWLVDAANPKNGLGGLIPDGFNVAFGDGTNRFVENAISDAEFVKMLTRAGSEVADFSNVENIWRTENQLRQMVLATHNYESAHMRFPKHGTYSDSGQPLLSWRVEILPFLEQNALYNMFNRNEPWDSPHNLSLLPLMPDLYATEGVANGFTVYQGSNGPNTMFPLSDFDFGFGGISDGTSNTAMFLKVDADKAIEWTRPLDLPFDASNPGEGLGGELASGFHFAAADGSIRFYNNALEREPLEFLLQRNDGIPFASEYIEGKSAIYSKVNIQNSLRQLALGAHNYESAHSRLPAHAIYSPQSASGTPMLSWRVELLPFLEHNDLYDMFNKNEPWDSPHNLSLLPLMPDVFAHPLVENGKTVFQAVTTPRNTGLPGAAFEIYYRGLSFGSFTDGTSNTALFVETNIDQAIEWTKPHDIMFDPNDPKFGLGDAYSSFGSNMAFTDGSTQFIENCVSPEFMSALLLRNDGESSSVHNTSCEDGIASRVAKASIGYNDVIAPDKTPLMPGQTATFANYGSFVDGITSLSIDIGRLTTPFAIGADDFVFRTGNGNEHSDFSDLGFAPAVTVAARAGASESDRVTLEFAAGSITNTWLQVTVLANEDTGLASDSTFYFGNAIGETGNDPNNAIVNLIDVALARQNQTGFGIAEADNAYDINRDGRVNLVDVAIIRANQSGFTPINLITAPSASSGRAGGKTSATSGVKMRFKGGLGEAASSFKSGGFSALKAEPELSQVINFDLSVRLEETSEERTDNLMVNSRPAARDENLDLRGAVRQLLENEEPLEASITFDVLGDAKVDFGFDDETEFVVENLLTDLSSRDW